MTTVIKSKVVLCSKSWFLSVRTLEWIECPRLIRVAFCYEITIKDDIVNNVSGLTDTGAYVPIFPDKTFNSKIPEQ